MQQDELPTLPTLEHECYSEYEYSADDEAQASEFESESGVESPLQLQHDGYTLNMADDDGMQESCVRSDRPEVSFSSVLSDLQIAYPDSQASSGASGSNSQSSASGSSYDSQASTGASS